MRRWLLALVLALTACAASAQTKTSLFDRVTPNPGGVDGDIYYTCSSGAAICRRPATTNGFFLTLAAGVPVWAAGCTAGSFTAGSVVFANGSGCAQNNAHFFWDDSNKFLGVGPGTVSTPLYPLHVIDSRTGDISSLYVNKTGTGNSAITIQANAATTSEASHTAVAGHVWGFRARGSTGVSPANGVAICDESVDATCAAGNGGRFFIDSGGHASVRAVPNSSYDFYSATIATQTFTLLGATSGSVSLGVTAMGGDGTRYNWPATAPASTSVLQCPVPTSTISTCTFVSAGGGITGTTSASFVPYSNGANAITDSTMSWDNTGKIVTTGIGGIDFKGSGSGAVGLVSPASPGPCRFVLPGADGSAGYILKTDGACNWSFVNPAVAGGGNFTTNSAIGSEPATPTAGDVNFPSNGMCLNRNSTGSSTGWGNCWGPIFPMTYPPTIVSTKTTTLSANINNAVTSLTFVVGTGWPSLPFLMQIGTEDFKVTALNTGTGVATVVRGYNGTTAASHTAGDTMTQLNWEWVNQGATATVTQYTNQGIYLDGGTSSAVQNARIYKRLIVNTTSGDVIAAIGSQVFALNGASVGILMRESATGKLMVFRIFVSSSNGPGYIGSDFVSPTVFGTNRVGPTGSPSVQIAFLRMTISGANILLKASINGQFWTQILSIAKTTVFTTAPDEWGIYADPISTTLSSGVQLYSWIEN